MIPRLPRVGSRLLQFDTPPALTFIDKGVFPVKLPPRTPREIRTPGARPRKPPFFPLNYRGMYEGGLPNGVYEVSLTSMGTTLSVDITSHSYFQHLRPNEVRYPRPVHFRVPCAFISLFS